MNHRVKHSADNRSPVASIVVTYQPEASLLSNLRQLSRQVSEIIVVDNGSSGISAQYVEAAGKLPGVHLIRNGSNLGIATALNVGIRHARQAGKQWIATFDQDSTIPDRYFEQLFQAYDSCPAARSVGMIVPGGWAEPGTGAEKKSPVKPSWSFVVGAVNSGSLIQSEVFQTTGFYDEALFIDYVDTEFCLRLQQHGFKILSANQVVLAHELGAKQTRRLLGFQISFRIHTAWRYYYIMRNRLILHRRYFALAPRWVLHDAGWQFLEIGRILVLEHGRWAKLQAVFYGVCDGLRSRTGRHARFPPCSK